MDEFDIFKLFFKSEKDYILSKSHALPVDYDEFRIEEVKDDEMFDSDAVAKGDNVDDFIC